MRVQADRTAAGEEDDEVGASLLCVLVLERQGDETKTAHRLLHNPVDINVVHDVPLPTLVSESVKSMNPTSSFALIR